MPLIQFSTFAKRHWEAFWFVLTEILPTILRTGKRPVIFARHGGIGDILCSFPATMELMKRHSGAVFFYNCHPDCQCLPRLAGLPVRTTASPDIGLVIFRYGWLVKKYYPFNYIDEVPGVTPEEILIQEFARTHGVMVPDDHPRLENDPAATAALKEILSQHGAQAESRPWIVIHTGPSWRVKEWPEAAWSTLVQQLRQQGYKTIFHVGVHKHLNFQTAQAPLIPNTTSLVGELTLEETIALISGADLFVGIDSGLLHIAASVGTPAVGVWGPTSPLMLYSQSDARSFVTSRVACQGCQHRYPRLHWMTGCPHDVACMRSISVEEVLAACLKRLKSGDA